MLRSLIVAACLCVASPAFAFFQGPWNVNAQHSAPTLQGYAKASRTGGEASVSAKLRGVIATIRAKYGKSAIGRIGGRSDRNVAGTRMVSCHSGGHAFDAHLSRPALAYVKGRHDLGVITYSGRMSHVHVSDCARERGYRGHTRSWSFVALF